MKTVLVTGASGFLGRHCVAALERRGYTVHSITRTPQAAPSAGVTWHQLDLVEQPAAVAELVDRIRPTHLLHAAWFVKHGEYWNSPENLRWVQASLNLLLAFGGAAGERAVFVGTCAEYAWGKGICKEDSTPLEPDSLYGIAKHALRQLVESYGKTSGISNAWGRLFLLYGPDESPERLVPSIIRSVEHGEALELKYPGDVRDFSYTPDVAEALAALLDSEVQGAVNIASGESVTLGSLASQIASLMGRPDLAIGPNETCSLTPLLAADVTRLRAEVGFAPKNNLSEGLRQTIDAWIARKSATVVRSTISNS